MHFDTLHTYSLFLAIYLRKGGGNFKKRAKLNRPIIHLKHKSTNIKQIVFYFIDLCSFLFRTHPITFLIDPPKPTVDTAPISGNRDKTGVNKIQVVTKAEKDHHQSR